MNDEPKRMRRPAAALAAAEESVPRLRGVPPRALTAGSYLALGWMAVIAIPPADRRSRRGAAAAARRR